MEKSTRIVLHLIGYWWSPWARELPHPADHRLAGWGGSERPQLVSYLKIAPIVQMFFGTSYCRFECGEANMGSIERSDGVWIWPDGLAHYVERHDVRLPDEFLAHVRRNRFDSSSFRFEYLRDPSPRTSLQKWLAWSSQWASTAQQEADREAAKMFEDLARRRAAEADHLESRLGVSDQRCAWHECSRRAIRDFAYCGQCAVRLNAHPPTT